VRTIEAMFEIEGILV